MEKLGGTICDNCRVLLATEEYYGINFKHYCSIKCFYDQDKQEEMKNKTTVNHYITVGPKKTKKKKSKQKRSKRK